MPANAFISFDHDDQQQVAGLKLLKSNPIHPLVSMTILWRRPFVIEAGSRSNILRPIRAPNQFVTRSSVNSIVPPSSSS